MTRFSNLSYARVTINLCQIYKNYARFQNEVTQHEKEAPGCAEIIKIKKSMFKKQLNLKKHCLQNI